MSQGGGEGLNASPPYDILKKGPLFIIFFSWKMQKFEEKRQNFEDLCQKFDYFSIFWSNFGDSCDY